MSESQGAPSKHYELAAGLVLPGVFGAELVFYFQVLTHDIATGFAGQTLDWLVLKYGLGLWFVLYVCTSFMVTVTNAERAKYDWRGFWIDTAESAVAFAALAYLGFVDVEVTHVYTQRPQIPLVAAFVAILLIALMGALHSSAQHHPKVSKARWIGGGASLVTALFLIFAAPHFPQLAALIAAYVGLIACAWALVSYFVGRWSKAQ